MGLSSADQNNDGSSYEHPEDPPPDLQPHFPF
jgi:hypothetical protein